MKKGLLFGFGLLLTGSALATTITVDTVSIDSKNPGDFVSNEEFNLITSGINAITTMFNDATDNGATITVPKTITATSLSAPEVCIGDDCQTEWPAGGNDISDQTCDTGYVVKGVTGGDFDCVLDANDGSGESPIDDMQPARWCWSPDGISIDCDREAPGSSSTSVDYQYWQCLPDGKTYWYTSTGVNMAIVKEDCTSLGGCINEEIGGTCINSTSGGTSITPLTCGAGEHLYKANSDGTFVCSADTGTGGTSVWTLESGNAVYKDGFVGIGTENPTTNLDVSGGEILAEKFCINTPNSIDACDSKTCSAGMESGEGGSTCFTQATLTAIESLVDTGGSTTSYWSDASPYSGGTGDIYYNESGNVGIGVTEPSAKLEVSGDMKLSNPDGSGGDLLLAGTIQVGGHFCPAPEATCTNAGEIASCGAGGAILACAGVDSKWMPITSHNGTLVGSNSYACTASQAGIMRFNNGTTQSLQICMKETGSTDYSWRTILAGGGTAQK